MCGIIGYIGEKKAAPILIEGLERLEYRGYDSAGISTLEYEGNSPCLGTRKSVGKISSLVAMLENPDKRNKPLSGTAGVAHTRWATHGAPSGVNAHPQLSRNKQVAVVHNGIIENHEHLRRELAAEAQKEIHSERRLR